MSGDLVMLSNEDGYAGTEVIPPVRFWGNRELEAIAWRLKHHNGKLLAEVEKHLVEIGRLQNQVNAITSIVGDVNASKNRLEEEVITLRSDRNNELSNRQNADNRAERDKIKFEQRIKDLVNDHTQHVDDLYKQHAEKVAELCGAIAEHENAWRRLRVKCCIGAGVFSIFVALGLGVLLSPALLH